jgi:hypothetical protein
MAKLNELIYNLKNLQNKGEHSDDQKLGNRQMEFILNHFRVEIAAQRANNNKSIDGFYQELDNTKLAQTRDFRPYRSDVTIFKSKDPVPTMATAHDVGFINQFVGTRDEFLGFQQSSVHTYNIDLENPYVQSVYFFVDNYLYTATKNSNLLREVFVRAVFNNPREVIEYNKGVDPMRGYDWEYPIPGNLIGSLNNLVINNEYRWMQVIPSDLVNDGNDAKQQGN